MIYLTWHGNSMVESHPAPESLIYEYSGEINLTDDVENELAIGSFQAYYADIGRAMNEGVSLFDVFDAHSQEMLEYAEALFDDDLMDLKPTVEQALKGDCGGLNVLVVNRLDLMPEYRGNDFGLQVLRNLMLRLSTGAGVIAIKPLPLQFSPIADKDDAWSKDMKFHKFTGSQITATKKLRKHYARLGFKEVLDSDLMVFSTAHRVPDI